MDLSTVRLVIHVMSVNGDVCDKSSLGSSAQLSTYEKKSSLKMHRQWWLLGLYSGVISLPVSIVDSLEMQPLFSGRSSLII